MSDFGTLHDLQDTLRDALGPDMSIVDLEPLDDGLSARIFAAGDTVVRVPRHREAADRQATIIAALLEIQPLLPIPVPALLATIPGSDRLPFGAAVLKRLPGIPMHPGHAGHSLSRALGRFLTALHAILPHHLSTSMIVRGRSDIDSARRSAMEIALPFLRSVLSLPDHEHIVQWWAAYTAHRTASRFSPSLIHGDLWYGNILVNPGHTRTMGILDWEEMAFDDPAQDFATLRHCGDAFCDDVLDAYTRAGGHVDDDLLTRREWHWECREIIGIATALRTEDASEIEDALHKLMKGPVMASRRRQ